MSTKKLALVLCVGAVVLLLTAGANAAMIFSAITDTTPTNPTVNLSDPGNADWLVPQLGSVMFQKAGGDIFSNLVTGLAYYNANNEGNVGTWSWTDGNGLAPTGTINGGVGTHGGYQNFISFQVWADTNVRTLTVWGEQTYDNTGNMRLKAGVLTAGNGANDSTAWMPGMIVDDSPYLNGHLLTPPVADVAMRQYTFDFSSDNPAGEQFNVVLDGGGTAIHMVAATVSAVPEPATMCLLAIGGIGALLRRRRKA